MTSTLYAGFWRRVVAAILDQIVLTVGRAFVYGAIVLMIYAGLYLFEIKDQHTLIFAVTGGCLWFLDIWLTWIYFALMESSSLKGTLGKLALGIRVYHRDQTRALTFEEATVRYFSKILSRMTLMVGYIMCAFSSRKQSLHDFVAKSVLLVK